MTSFSKIEKLPFDVKKAVTARVSTRSFEKKSLSEEDKTSILDFFNSQANPFGVNVRMQYISKKDYADNVQFGTYGTIKGAKDFLAITVKDQPFAMEAVGYQFENLVLKATDMGLGTVWLAATFSRKDFEKSMEICPDDLFPCICPIGYPLGKRSVMEKIKQVDLGIALSHFHQTALQDNLDGYFEKKDIALETPDRMHYVISYVVE